MKNKTRESNIELLRIFAMLMILCYHACHQLKATVPETTCIVYLYTILHNGVPLFLLISGYFMIKLSIKKVVSFYWYCVLWALICMGISYIFNHEHVNVLAVAKQFLPFSHPTVWYTSYYFWLILMAPLCNALFKQTSIKEHTIILLVLYFAVVYFGLVWQAPIINNGRSIIYFLYMYLLIRKVVEYPPRDINVGGKTLNVNVISLGVEKLLMLSVVYLFFVLLVTLLLPHSFGRAFRGLVFSYQGPILPVTSILIFLLFLKIRVKNNLINKIAASVFAVYLLHENAYCHYLFRDNITEIYLNNPPILAFIKIIVNIVIVFVGAIVIDMFLRAPIQKILERWTVNFIYKTCNILIR